MAVTPLILGPGFHVFKGTLSEFKESQLRQREEDEWRKNQAKQTIRDNHDQMLSEAKEDE